MTTDEIKKELIELIAELFKEKGFDADLIEYVDLIDDLGMDSITFISIVIEIEAKFGIIVPNDMLFMENFKKIDEIINIVELVLTKQLAKTEDKYNVKA